MLKRVLRIAQIANCISETPGQSWLPCFLSADRDVLCATAAPGSWEHFYPRHYCDMPITLLPVLFCAGITPSDLRNASDSIVHRVNTRDEMPPVGGQGSGGSAADENSSAGGDIMSSLELTTHDITVLFFRP